MNLLSLLLVGAAVYFAATPGALQNLLRQLGLEPGQAPAVPGLICVGGRLDVADDALDALAGSLGARVVLLQRRGPTAPPGQPLPATAPHGPLWEWSVPIGQEDAIVAVLRARPEVEQIMRRSCYEPLHS